MDELLARANLKYRREATPLVMTFPVNPDAAPFLVSSNQGFVWVGEAQQGFVHTYVQDIGDEGKLNQQIVEAIARTGEEAGWGNVHPLTEEGLEAAIQYVRYYGLEDLEILVPDDETVIEFVSSLVTIPITVMGWLEKYVVVVPKDRNYLGTLGRLSRKKYIVLVHNPSRGLGLVQT